MSKTLFPLILGLCCSLLCPAQSKEERIMELFEVMQVPNQMNAMVVNMMASVEQQLAIEFTDEHKRKEITNFLIDETQLLSEKLLTKDMSDAYAELFTIEEIEALLIFYRSDIGQKVLRKTPVINQIILDRMIKIYLPEAQQRLVAKITSME